MIAIYLSPIYLLLNLYILRWADRKSTRLNSSHRT